MVVSSESVNSQLSSIKSKFESYDSSVSDLSGKWSGLSYDSFSSQAKSFSNDYLSSISNQMDSFSKACDLYKNYLATKSTLADYNECYKSATTDAERVAYQSKINGCVLLLKSQASQISSSLNSVLSVKLEATPLPGCTFGVKDWTDNANFTYFNQGHKPNSSEAWGNYDYSDGGGSNTMGASGCGPTSMAMVASSLGHEVTPEDTANWSAENGYHVKGGTVNSFFPKYADEIGVSCDEIGGRNSKGIADSLSDGKLMILDVESGDFTSNLHFIVARGYDPETNKVLIADPNHEDRCGWWDLDRVAGQTINSWSFSNT